MALTVSAYNPMTEWKRGVNASIFLNQIPELKPISEWMRPFLNVAPYLFDFLQNPLYNEPLFSRLCLYCYLGKQITAFLRSPCFSVCSISVDESGSQELNSSDSHAFRQHPSCLLESHFLIFANRFFFISTLHQFHHCAVAWPHV